jgi:hypothetical protein
MNLQITDNIYPSIDYNGGKVWLDEKANIEISDWYLYDNQVRQWDDRITSYQKLTGYKIIAQTPDLQLEGVPVVEVDVLTDDERNAIWNQAVKRFGFINEDMPRFFAGVYAGYKAAQSKGTYTEEQVYKAFKWGQRWCNDINNETFNQLIKSIQPEIVVEMERVPKYVGTFNGGKLKTGYYDSKPITYIKDGRVILEG